MDRKKEDKEETCFRAFFRASGKEAEKSVRRD